MADHHGVAASELSPSEEQLSFDQLLSAFPAMQQALQSAHSSLLHGHCCAHGDARLPHVFAHREGQQCKVKFLDFNWAGIAGEHLPTVREFKHTVASRSYLFEHYTAAA